jgi:D-Tyr-tRNAtyr deacylase
MRAVIQRAERAEVRVIEPAGARVAGSIGRGLAVLLGVETREAQRLFDRVGVLLREAGVAVETGVFGGDMRVELVNDGPVTLVIESPG